MPRISLLLAVCAILTVAADAFTTNFDIPTDRVAAIFDDVDAFYRRAYEILTPRSNATARKYYKRMTPEVRIFGRDATIFATAAARIAREFNISHEHAEDVVSERAALRPEFNANAMCQTRITSCNLQSKYRTADGSCNNPNRWEDGMAVIRMDRMIPARYRDGNGGFRLQSTGETYLSPRICRLIVIPEAGPLHTRVTNMIVGFGQFLDHDITSTPENSNLDCCNNPNNPECMAISVPTNDPFYSQFNPPITCIDIGRSVRACGAGQREQINQATAFIDGSQIYGNSLQEQRNLRSMMNGLLLTDTNSRFLPKDPQAANCGNQQAGITCFRAGDGRLNENPGLTSLHTICMREHNRIATGLRAINPGWSDETLYQEARRIMVAQLQNIVYGEYLPVVLGPDAMSAFFLNLPTGSGTTTYDSSVRPNIFNCFATAAYRFGHTLIRNQYSMPGNGVFNLETTFQNPQPLYQDAANCDRIVKGMSQDPAMEYDNQMAQAVLNHLFQRPGAAAGSDLASLNIQRGRDHGLPPYNDFRVSCGLSRLASFADLLPVVGTQDIVNRFQDSYRTVGDVELWPAIISELPVAGGVVGPTGACIVARQFNKLMWGDRFFFTHANQAGSFTATQLANLRQRTLGSIMCDNASPTVTDTQQNVHVLGGSRIACSQQAKLNLNNWKA